jgi:hypothetical protein
MSRYCAVLLLRDPTREEKEAVKNQVIPDRVRKQFQCLYSKEVTTEQFRLDITDISVIIIQEVTQ